MFSKNNPKYTRCRLCGNSKRLCQSHLHPKFYWDWLKQTGTGYFRSSDKPNLRRQDGFKLPMLCLACEGRFSRLETVFAAEVFRPVAENTSTVLCYSALSVDCLISILWRCLAYDLDVGFVDQLPPSLRPELLNAEQHWRNYLLSEAPLRDFICFNMFVTDFPLQGSPQVNLYMVRDADASSMWTSQDLIGFYTKFGKIMVVAGMSGFDSAGWINTSLNPAGGVFAPGTTRVTDGRFGEFLMDRASRQRHFRKQLQQNISPTQLAAITKNIEKLGEQFDSSDLRRAHVLDAAWERSLPKVRRNDPCPCNSGRKYKKCHGA